MRESPTTSARVLTVLTIGDKVTATGAPKDADGYTWRNVRNAAGTEGWVAAEFLAP